MQIRETKVSPLPSGKSVIEIVYSDHADEQQAATYFRYRCVLQPKGRSSLAGIQREALEAAREWLDGESLKLRNEMA